MSCPACGRPLREIATGVACVLPCPYVRISMPAVGLGYLFAADGRPWGALRDRHGHGLPKGWRDKLMGAMVPYR